ncbi:GTP-binding protein [Micromonospora sp. NPDC049101]|uniref:GTP-binding protein n=1 Tax=unclassified Micromonospora TaxID=2617518 RepID=UPI0034030081
MSTRFIVLSGFLGAGKTTTMTTAAQQLRAAGHRVAVITNDQGVELVDTAVAAEGLAGVGEVTGGCFCCRFEDLLAVMSQLIRRQDADVIIAESVGSCTDLTATVVRPLAALHGDDFSIAPMTTVVDPIRYLRLLPDLDRGDSGSDLTYLYRKQLEDAAVIGVNKIDLLAADEVDTVVTSLTRRFPQAEVVTYSASTQQVAPLLDCWTRDHTADSDDLDVDYQRYGAAEARLAWLDQTLDLKTPSSPFEPAAWMRTVLQALARGCRAEEHMIGHVKLMFQDAASGTLTKASLIDYDRPSAVDLAGAATSLGGRAVLNARVACEPAQLEHLASDTVAEADQAWGVQSRLISQRSFKPGQPEPTHRMLVGNAFSGQ